MNNEPAENDQDDEDLESGCARFELVMPFWIDTDGYTLRDREMFCAGFEFCDVLDEVLTNEDSFERIVHTENASRIRMMAAKCKRACSITLNEEDPIYSVLKVE